MPEQVALVYYAEAAVIAMQSFKEALARHQKFGEAKQIMVMEGQVREIGRGIADLENKEQSK